MTIHIHDSLLYKGQEYSIVGINGHGLFHPQDYGWQPLGLSSACWRGFLCQYLLKDNRLYLNWLRINRGHHTRTAPVINGVCPEAPPEDYPVFDTFYPNLHLEIHFSGGMLLGMGFIPELYVHMGLHPAWKFETVIELIFTKGFAEEVRDVSEKVAEKRKDILQKSWGENSLRDGEIQKEWIKSTFQLDYHLE